MAERPNIQSVKNDIIDIAIPAIDDKEVTYLTDEVLASGVTLTIKSNAGFAQNVYAIFEDVGSRKSEIKRITAVVTAGTALTVAATTFSHGVGTKITLVRYDQVEIYGSSSASDAAPTLIGSAENINVAEGRNQIKAATTYTYYYARFKDSNAGTYSSYSDSVAATGLTAQARGEIKKEFLSIYNERVDDLITDEWLNRAINRWQRELSKRRKYWNVLRYPAITDLVRDTQGYALPTDIQDYSQDSVTSVKVANQPELTFVDDEIFTQLTYGHIGSELAADVAVIDTSITIDDSSDFASPTGSETTTVHIQGDEITYGTNTKSTGVLSEVTGITATHTTDDEVWQTYTTGQPTKYTIDPQTGKIKLNPIPDSGWADKNLYITYWRKFVDLSDDADATLFPYPENCYLYMNWQVAIRRRLSEDVVLSRRAEWKSDLEDRVMEDPEAREIRIEPHNLYGRKY